MSSETTRILPLPDQSVKSVRKITAQSAYVEACVEFIREVGGGVSFVELVGLLERRGVAVRGTLAITTHSDPNLILWYGLSEVAADILRWVMAHPDIACEPTHWMTYAADGVLPKMPTASRLPEFGFQQPHWLPITLTLNHPTGRMRHVLGHEMVRTANGWEAVAS